MTDTSGRVAVVRAMFDEKARGAHGELFRSCCAALDEGGVSYDVFEVPGSFELPVASKWAAESGRYGAVVALGIVVRGETVHFDLVAGEAARGIAQVGLDTGVPVLFGVLAVETEEQADARAHLGASFARGAVAMMEVRRLSTKK